MAEADAPRVEGTADEDGGPEGSDEGVAELTPHVQTAAVYVVGWLGGGGLMTGGIKWDKTSAVVGNNFLDKRNGGSDFGLQASPKGT